MSFNPTVMAAANAAGFYNSEADRFSEAHAKATEYLLSRVSAGGKRRYRKGNKRRELIRECMERAGVPAASMTDWLKWAFTLGSYVAPFPWNIVIAAIKTAVDAFLA